jgi:hypothetical protein
MCFYRFRLYSPYPKSADTNYTGRWVRPAAGLGNLEMKNSLILPGIKTGFLSLAVRISVTKPHELSGTPE